MRERRHSVRGRRRILFRLFIRQRGRCAYCLRPLYWPPPLTWGAGPYSLSSRQITLDHVIPWAAGGPDHESNFVAACSRCNSRKREYIVAPRLPPVAA